MNDKIAIKLRALCWTVLDMSKECNEKYQFQRLLLIMTEDIEKIIEESEIENDYKQSKRD